LDRAADLTGPARSVPPERQRARRGRACVPLSSHDRISHDPAGRERAFSRDDVQKRAAGPGRPAGRVWLDSPGHGAVEPEA
jgi:hypothetical protein